MDHWPADLRAILNRIADSLEQRTGRFSDLPATEPQIAAVERAVGREIPEDLRALLRFDRTLTVFEYARIPPEHWPSQLARGAVDGGRVDKGNADRAGGTSFSEQRWLPLFEDGGGNLWIADLSNPQVLIRQWERDGWEVADEGAPILAFFGRLALALESGRLTYLPDSGCFDGPYVDLMRRPEIMEKTVIIHRAAELADMGLRLAAEDFLPAGAAPYDCLFYVMSRSVSKRMSAELPEGEVDFADEGMRLAGAVVPALKDCWDLTVYGHTLSIGFHALPAESTERWLRAQRDLHVHSLLPLLAAAENVLPTYKVGSGVLHAVFFSSTPERLEALLAEGADPNERDKYGRSILALVAACDKAKTVALLIDHGADVDQSNEDELRYTPLIEATRENSPSAVAELLARGAQVNAVDSRNGSAALHAAIAALPEMHRMLRGAGADLDLGDEDGRGPLHHICEHARSWDCSDSGRYEQHCATADTLLELGASPNQADTDGFTPLMLAAANDALELVQTLLDAGAGIDLRSRAGITALHGAIRTANSPIVELLIDRGADVNLADKYGFSALMWAVARRKIELVKLLVEHGANRQQRVACGFDEYEPGMTPLDVARKRGYGEIAAWLEHAYRPGA